MRDSASSARSASSGLPGQGTKASGSISGAPVDFGALAARAPDDVGVEADHRIAPALRAALDRLEQEHVARRARRRA